VWKAVALREILTPNEGQQSNPHVKFTLSTRFKLNKTVKKFGAGGLHVTLPTKSFSIGDNIEILKKDEYKELLNNSLTEDSIRGIIREELENVSKYG